jgi:serine O-acetyltransferase
MSQTAEKFATVDPVWSKLRNEALTMVKAEPVLASFVHATILNHEQFENALSFHLSQKLGNADMNAMSIRQVFDEAFEKQPAIGEAVRADLSAILDRDPACRNFVEPFLYYKGFHAVQAYRVAHWLWNQGRKHMAFYLQNRISEQYAVDIHPAAKLGRGLMMDHATGVVIGETAVVEDDVSMLHEVTLGGTGKETGDRHPKIRKGSLLSAGAKILGNIEVGECARVGAGSVVLIDVPANCTAAGVPAKIIGCAGCEQPSHEMNQMIDEAGEGI